MRSFFIIAIVSSVALAGCAWVQLTEQGEAVRVVDAGQVTDCRRIGETTARVRDRVAAVQRSPGKVAEELERLARNEAAVLGGDHVVALEPVRDGRRRYAVFDCRPAAAR